MKAIGHAPINPVIFYTGKFAGYAVWVVWVLSVTGIADSSKLVFPVLQQLSYVAFGGGLMVAVVSLINLGKSTRLGLPNEDTELVTNGLYRFSRHPMYVGFHLFTLAGVLYTLNPYVIIAAVYSVSVYHYIIKAEEEFLVHRFGPLYDAYSQKVRRYL